MSNIRSWPDWFDMTGGKRSVPRERSETDLRFFKDVFLYLGINGPKDEDAAMRDLLAMADEGHTSAADMISFAIGYEPDTFKPRSAARPPDFRDNQIRFWEENCIDWDETMLYYKVSYRFMLSSSPEWRLLSMLADISVWGFSYDSPKSDVWGNYEDDVIRVQPHAPDGDQPTLIFKPSGYSMQWYKYPWRCPLQSENLSMGEVRRILRLAVEHIAYGRSIPKGTTAEMLALPRHLYAPPADIAGDLYQTAIGAPTNRSDDRSNWDNPALFD